MEIPQEQSLVDLAVQKSEAKSDALEMKKEATMGFDCFRRKGIQCMDHAVDEVKRLSEELDDLSATKSALKEARSCAVCSHFGKFS